MANTTQNGSARKGIERPKKPYPDFPLSPHPRGQWQKKIRGKIHYFGRWARRENGKLVRVPGDGWKEALEAYKRVADDLHAGRTPRAEIDGLTIRDLCNAFDKAKGRKLEAKEITQRTYDGYVEATDLVVATFGKNRLVDDLHPEDFGALRGTMAKRWGPVRLGNVITRVKSVFKYGTDNGLIEKTIRYGSEFRKPGMAVLRRHRAANGKNMLESPEVRKLVDAAPVPLKAMILLGVNCGFGPTDCAMLPIDVVDLETGWIDYPRRKTGIERRCPLWPETVEALREALSTRPTPKRSEWERLVFVTARGNQWMSGNAAHPITASVVALMKDVGVHRQGLGPYTLRHVFRTVADGSRDQPAVDLVMGHADHTMAGLYRERIDDSRLRAVADHVRAWLFPAAKGGES